MSALRDKERQRRLERLSEMSYDNETDGASNDRSPIEQRGDRFPDTKHRTYTTPDGVERYISDDYITSCNRSLASIVHSQDEQHLLDIAITGNTDDNFKRLKNMMFIAPTSIKPSDKLNVLRVWLIKRFRDFVALQHPAYKDMLIYTDDNNIVNDDHVHGTTQDNNQHDTTPTTHETDKSNTHSTIHNNNAATDTATVTVTSTISPVVDNANNASDSVNVTHNTKNDLSTVKATNAIDTSHAKYHNNKTVTALSAVSPNTADQSQVQQTTNVTVGNQMTTTTTTSAQQQPTNHHVINNINNNNNSHSVQQHELINQQSIDTLTLLLSPSPEPVDNYSTSNLLHPAQQQSTDSATHNNNNAQSIPHTALSATSTITSTAATEPFMQQTHNNSRIGNKYQAIVKANLSDETKYSDDDPYYAGVRIDNIHYIQPSKPALQPGEPWPLHDYYGLESDDISHMYRYGTVRRSRPCNRHSNMNVRCPVNCPHRKTAIQRSIVDQTDTDIEDELQRNNNVNNITNVTRRRTTRNNNNSNYNNNRHTRTNDRVSKQYDNNNNNNHLTPTITTRNTPLHNNTTTSLTTNISYDKLCRFCYTTRYTRDCIHRACVDCCVNMAVGCKSQRHNDSNQAIEYITHDNYAKSVFEKLSVQNIFYLDSKRSVQHTINILNHTRRYQYNLNQRVTQHLQPLNLPQLRPLPVIHYNTYTNNNSLHYSNNTYNTTPHNNNIASTSSSNNTVYPTIPSLIDSTDTATNSIANNHNNNNNNDQSNQSHQVIELSD